MDAIKNNIPEKYIVNFLKEDHYTTPPSSKAEFIINPTFSFYLRLVGIIIRSNLKTKINKYDRYAWVKASYQVIKAMEKVGVEFKLEGLKNVISFEGPAVFIGNHMGTLETMMLPAILQPAKPIVYVMKKELTTFPVFGPVSSARHPVVVGRDNPREDLRTVMEEGSRRLQEGRSVIIFPQRTRSKNLLPKSFNSLGIKLAKRNDVPAVPMALITDAWGIGKFLKDFGKIDPSRRVRLAIGEPIHITSQGNKEHQQVIDFIKRKWIDWGYQDFIIEEG